MGYLEDVYGGGDTKVYYAHHKDCLLLRDKFKCITLMDLRDLDRTHALIGTVPFTNPDVIYSKMQGENWSPEGEAIPLIRSKKVRHTSMSVGDVLCLGNGDCKMVDNFGFIDIGNLNNPPQKLPVIDLLDDGNLWYVDDRLKEFRRVDKPSQSMSFDKYDELRGV